MDARTPGRFDISRFEPMLAEIHERLARLRGSFVLSINDTPEMREVFGRFAIERVETTYTISTATTGAGVRAGELIVKAP